MYRFRCEDGYPFFPDETIAADGVTLCDRFEDFLLLLDDFAAMWPNIAYSFWYSDENDAMDMPMSAVHHPFLQIVAKASESDNSLMATTWRFFASLAGGGQGICSSHVYSFMKVNQRHQKLTWSFLFDAITSVTSMLTESVSGRYVDGIGNTGSLSRSIAQMTTGLSYDDQDSLMAILELILAAVRSSAVANQLILDGFNPIAKIAALLPLQYSPLQVNAAVVVDDLSMEIRGKVFEILACFVNASATAAEEVWSILEASQALPMKASEGILAIENKALAKWRGIREDLENVESKTGKYAVTEGFLQLLYALFRGPGNRGSENIGSESASLYLEYVVENVFLKLSSRLYAPDGVAGRGQEYRLAYRCLLIFACIIEDYDSDSMTEDFSSNQSKYLRVSVHHPQRGQRSSALAKSLGYQVMCLILGQSRLLQSIFSILQVCIPSKSYDSLKQRSEEVAVDSIKIMRRTRFDKNSNGSITSLWTELKTAAGVSSEESSEPDLSAYAMSSSACDCAYWQALCADAAIGLLYECMQKESKFMQLYRSAISSSAAMEESFDSYVAVDLKSSSRISSSTKLNQMASNASRPLQAFTEIMCSIATLGIIAEYIVTDDNACGYRSNPSIEVMAIKLIGYVAAYASTSLVTGLFFGSMRDESLLKKQIMSCILADDDSDGDDISIAIQPLGGSETSASFSSTVHHERETRRQAAFNLFLLSLRVNDTNISLSHYLLGYRQWKDQASREVADAEDCEHCLDAILLLLGPNSLPQMLSRYPTQVRQCYEILTLVCNSFEYIGEVNGNSIAFSAWEFLHRRSFVSTQLQELAYLWQSLMSDASMLSAEERAHRFRMKTGLLDSLSWFLQCCCIDLCFHRDSINTKALSSSPLLQYWITLFVGSNNSLGNVEQATAFIPFLLFSLFDGATVLSEETAVAHVRSVPSAAIRNLMEDCLKPIDTDTESDSKSARKSPSRRFYQIDADLLRKRLWEESSDWLKPTPAKATPAQRSSSFYPSAAMSKAQLGEGEVQEAIDIAIRFNLEQQQFYAAFQMLRSWQRFVSMLFTRLRSDLDLDRYASNHLVDTNKQRIVILQRIVLDSLLPLLRIIDLHSNINTANTSIVIVEELAIAAFAICQGIAGCIVPSEGQQTNELFALIASTVFLKDVYSSALQRIISALLSLSQHGVAAAGARGYLQICLSTLLQIPEKMKQASSSFLISSSYMYGERTEISEEDKEMDDVNAWSARENSAGTLSRASKVSIFQSISLIVWFC
jgi:hypothetical protein